jgi:hypothetical protein
VLQGLGANIIYALLGSGVNSLRRFRRQGQAVEPLPTPPIPLGLDVGPKVRDIVRAVAANANGRHATLKIRHQRGDETLEVELEIQEERRPPAA